MTANFELVGIALGHFVVQFGAITANFMQIDID